MHKTTTDNITKWKITLDANGKKNDIAEFEFFIENGKVWLNNWVVWLNFGKFGKIMVWWVFGVGFFFIWPPNPQRGSMIVKV